MDAATPCRCPRCGWLGTIHDAEAYQPLAHLEPLNICPRCATETEVQPLGQKGLDGLYREYALLLKPGYQHEGDRAERRAQLERFFEHRPPAALHFRPQSLRGLQAHRAGRQDPVSQRSRPWPRCG